MNVLVINCGSSSLKFKLIDTDLEAISGDGDLDICSGQIERIGSLALLTLIAFSQDRVDVNAEIPRLRIAPMIIVEALNKPRNAVKRSKTIKPPSKPLSSISKVYWEDPLKS